MKRNRQRAVSNTQTVDCLRFSLINLPPRTNFVIQGYSLPGTSLEEDEESMDFCIHFRPPLSRNAAAQVRVGVVYVGDKIQRSRSPYLCFLPVLPEEGGEKYSLLPNYLDYELFETHQLRTYGTKGQTIGSMYLTFENNMTRPDHAVGVFIELKVDMTLKMLPQLLPGEFLMWFPPDVDPAEYGIKVDPRLIPQRTKLWFKMRGISGTKAYTLLGFWVGKDSKFGSQQRAIMRLGSLSEDYALLCYFSKFDSCRFQEMGWCPAPARKYPDGWGASPDGLFIDQQMKWSDVPEATKDFYRPEGFNIHRGVCEIKTSETNTSMSAYYIPQMYMEMIALESVWADLLRFHHHREFENGKWIFKDKLYVYRIYRDPELEKVLLKLWKYAIDRIDKLVEVAAEEAFVSIRKKLEKKAKALKPIAIIDAPVHTFEKYTQYREDIVYAAASRTAEEMEASESQQLWCDLNERHKKLLCMDEKSQRQDMARLMSEQLEDYSFLLKQFI